MHSGAYRDVVQGVIHGTPTEPDEAGAGRTDLGHAIATAVHAIPKLESEEDLSDLPEALQMAIVCFGLKRENVLDHRLTEDGVVIGFDGSEAVGRARIAEQMARIFADHATGTYVGIVREVTSLGSEAALLRAVSGVVPAGGNDIEPPLNATQSLVAQRRRDGWRVVLYQNTPAQYHGRPEVAQALTAELRGSM